jgi:hypothetical protein
VPDKVINRCALQDGTGVNLFEEEGEIRIMQAFLRGLELGAKWFEDMPEWTDEEIIQICREVREENWKRNHPTEGEGE